MEKVKRKRRHLVRNLSLKWSFSLYMLACTLVAITLSVIVAATFSSLQSNLYYKYETQFLEDHSLTEDAIRGDAIVDESEILVYRTNNSFSFSPEDAELYRLYGIVTVLSVPFVCLLCILATGLLFYQRKLKKPMQLIDAASARIAAGDLDFALAYENKNEMGRLAASFETMRASLKENNQEMWRMMDARKRLNTAFAHDLRTPLTVLRGYTEYLRAYVPQQRVPEEKLLSTVDLMHAYVLRLEGYTESMSAMQKLEEVKPRPAAIAFDALCARLRSAAAMLSGPHHLQFECDGSGSVFVDADMLVQVLENLVSNASRYAERVIWVRVSEDAAVVRMTIADDGPGFPDSVLRKGLVPYNHKKEEDVRSDHYGLGLYICAVLCERHGGALVLPEAAGQSQITATFARLAS